MYGNTIQDVQENKIEVENKVESKINKVEETKEMER